jgi:glycosyltransferase involved in cell wall biosynthesis
MRLSASLIVKNEEAHIEECLKSIQGVDEIIVCDTGSTDNTVEIAKRFTDKVFTDYTWEDHFAKARNHALSKCTGDWVLSIDADETLACSVDKIREIVSTSVAPKVYCRIQAKGKDHEYVMFPRLFRRTPEIYWIGAAHNYLSKGKGIISDITIIYGYSKAHKNDPARTLRILAREVNNNPACSRERYYLAREFWYRKDYETAVYHYDFYLQNSKWLPEKADAYLMRAKCLWKLNRGEEARVSCLSALHINANFKEAHYLMAEMTYSPNKEAWISFAQLASNDSVLFVRVK